MDAGGLALRAAYDALAQGKPIIVQDHDMQPQSAAIVAAAKHATTSLAAFAIRHGSGLLRVVLPYERTVDLMIPSMDSSFDAVERMCVSVDALQNITTGISAADRGRTARVLADPLSTPNDLVRPGHLMVSAVDPCAQVSTVSEAAARLVHEAGCGSAALVTEIVGTENPLGLACGDEPRQFASTHGLICISVDEVQRFTAVE
ncbi:3,4-dihydroxy-2-butanone-4-phosphate synthase [Rhodococcus rhodochrous]|uniref:3,4-dihydroxy-2-butanone-4-phosphate synthase n=1 Tax=Rhodococcus rhodochrous TaxID=1829 RepID=UPI0012FD639B|nr:3,4-dihydroxy-2-butanone-4-phosphate synthase [Rhodococcus rhodochrous]